MNYTRVHSLLSKASEAIVSSDGKIKKRLNNYETVVGQDEDDPFYIPSGAVNDNYGNLNYLTSKIRDQKVTAKLSKLRYMMFAAFTLVILGFSWSAYKFLMPTIGSGGDFTQQPEDSLATVVHETQLERIANLIIEDGNWSNSRVTQFAKHWFASSPEERESYKDTAWYQHFTFRLDTTFNRAIHTGELLSDGKLSKENPVYKLALALGVADPKIDYAEVIQKDKNYQQLESAVATELAKMEQSRLNGEKQETQVVVDEQSLAKLLKDSEGKPLIQPGSPKSVESANQVSEATRAPSTDTKVASVPSAPPVIISEEDVSRVFEKYASAYQSGNLGELSSLFGVNDPAQGQNILEQLKANYETVFANSQKRSVSFKGINWRVDGNQATVDSDYRATIELKNNKGTQTIYANARIGLQKTSSDLKIASFELLNRSVNVVTPELKLSSTDKKERQLPDTPTAAELQDIVTRLVSSYETGDLNSFTSLFTLDAKTNDRQNLAGIKSDYQDLFKNSNDRQMFIQGMQWSYDKKHAKGIGDLEAIVLSDSGQTVYTLSGKIQLVAKRVNGKVHITHMYHIEREK